MKVYFKNSAGKVREIADVETRSEAFKAVNKFCSDRNFKVYYIRTWETELNGTPMTELDVGSHTEFFYIEKE